MYVNVDSVQIEMIFSKRWLQISRNNLKEKNIENDNSIISIEISWKIGRVHVRKRQKKREQSILN